MSARFQELGWEPTDRGELVLRRRRDSALDVDVYEVKLGAEYLMSSLFTVAEVELARLGLAAVAGSDSLDVVVGGLGLGYTARAVLDDPRVRTMSVLEASPAVVEWHRRELLPVDAALVHDRRTRLVVGDFFAWASGEPEVATGVPPRVHAVLVDIDHTPRHWLHPRHAEFYSEHGLRRLSARLHPGGVFALWSDDPPDDDFRTVLDAVFPGAAAHVVDFANHLTGGTSSNTVYVGSLSR
jgi:spermidine synthase